MHALLLRVIKASLLPPTLQPAQRADSPPSLSVFPTLIGAHTRMLAVPLTNEASPRWCHGRSTDAVADAVARHLHPHRQSGGKPSQRSTSSRDNRDRGGVSLRQQPHTTHFSFTRIQVTLRFRLYQITGCDLSVWRGNVMEVRTVMMRWLLLMENGGEGREREAGIASKL